jgi:hypothetical protein
MNNRFNNVSAIRGTPIRSLDVPTRASTTSYRIGPNASTQDLAAIQEMETRLTMQDLAAIQEMETRIAIQKHAVAHPIHLRVATPGAFEFRVATRVEHPMQVRVATPAASELSSVHFAQPHVRFAVPDASEERIRELRSVHFAQPRVQPARARHIDASEAALAWGQAQTRHTQLRLQLRAMNVPPQTPLLRAVWEEQYRAKFRECEEAAREEIRLDLLLQQARCS